MKRLLGPLVLALVAATPSLPLPSLRLLFAGLAAAVAGAAVVAVRLRRPEPVVWAVLASGAAATMGVLAHGPAAGIWALCLGLLLLLGAELTFAASRPEPRQERLLVWRWEYLAAALSAVALSLVPQAPAGAGLATSILGLAAVGALVALLALLVVRSPR